MFSAQLTSSHLARASPKRDVPMTRILAAFLTMHTRKYATEHPKRLQGPQPVRTFVREPGSRAD